MSSTNRGAERNRDDFYATPDWVTWAILPHLDIRPNDREGFDALDPCCGDGAILDVLRQVGATTFGIELDADRAAEAVRRGHHVECADMFAATWPAVPLTITNPPFCRAQDAVERALEAARPLGTVAMLLRLAFLESAERAAFHKANPSDVYVLANRPSFCVVVTCVAPQPQDGDEDEDEDDNGCGWRIVLSPHEPRPKRCVACGGKVSITTSDSCAYAWFVWGPGRGGRILVLDDADPDKRRRGKR